MLQQLNRILQAESQASPPHLCFQHVAQAQLYTQLSQLAASLLDNPIVHEVLEIFNTLIEYEDDDFLGIKDFADDVARMAHTTSASGTLMEESTHVMVEMLFGIAAKIKHHPSYLQVWFRPKPESNEQHQWEASKKPRSSSDKQAFPLFYYFLNYIHLDITAGEFSRTGLIYIVEAADCDEALERWIIESDLATLMASGLGALYSQLSRKLVVAHGDDPVPAVYALSDGHRSIPEKATVPSPSKIDQDLRSFLVFLAFWQDILEYCKSADVRQTLLDHFEHIFMQQVLYPSMLESSDKDGGSSVAILTYIRLIVESVTYPDLIRVFLRFLLANRTPPAMEAGNKSARPAALARRRKSQNLLEEEERSQNRLIPDLFSLIDLVLSSLRSGDQQTVAGTLQLVSALLQTQYTYVMSSLLRVQNAIPESVKYSLEMHEKNLDDLDRLAARLFNFEEPSESTESHRQDAEHLIEMHCTTDSTLQFPSRLDGDPSLIPTHIIPSQSPFLNCLLSLLEHFFLRDISTNLFLTQTIVVLACCGRSSLKGWLLTDYDTSEEPSPAQATNARSPNNLTASSPLPSLEASLTHQNSTSTSPSHSSLIAALYHLVTQVSTFRAQITDFDAHLSEQKHAFNVWDQMARVTKTISQLKSTESSTQSDPISNAKSHTNPIPSRLRTSKQSSLSPSRSGSPRGRRSAELPFTGGFTSLTGRLGQLRVSASPSPLRFDQRARKSPSDMSPTRQVCETIGGEQRLLTVDGGMIPHKMVKVPVSGGLYGEEADGEKEVLLSQVLTNVIILHDFILELMAVVEVRASLFGEVVM